jgi:N-acetyl-gamma-glutamyl-phosphate reductase
MPRGILATITMKLNQGVSAEQVRVAYERSYSDEPYVNLLPQGQMPRTAAVTGSNMVAIQVGVDEHTNRLVISVAIDNLVKGAAGQAIQNANLICGFDETLGLTQLGLGT